MPKRQHSQIDIDSNALNSTTTAVNIFGTSTVTAYINDNTGTHNTCEVRLQVSPNGTGANWYNVGDILSGNRSHTTVSVVADYARFRVTTAEGSTSTYKGFIRAV